MSKSIQIDGKKYEVLGTETKGDSFGIHTDTGAKGGTYWMKPCEPKTGQAAFYMGKDGFVVTLPPECPQRISRITFDEPDLTNQFPEEVKADYLAYKKHCEKTGGKMLSLEQYKARVAVSNVWKRHETPELVLQYGYIADDFLIYYRNLKGQMIDPACLHKFKWAAEYMDEDGRGTFIFFERLAGPDPLPKGYDKTVHEVKVPRQPRVRTAKEKQADKDREKMPPQLKKKVFAEIKKLTEVKNYKLLPAAENVHRRMASPDTNGWGWDVPADQIPTVRHLTRLYKKHIEPKPKT